MRAFEERAAAVETLGEGAHVEAPEALFRATDDAEVVVAEERPQGAENGSEANSSGDDDPIPSGGMDTAPIDGRRVWLIDGDGAQVEAYHRTTRAIVRGQWRLRSFWALWLTTTPIPFEPVGWLPATGL